MELLLFTLHSSDLLIFIMRMCYLCNALNIYKNRKVATKFSGKSILNCFPNTVQETKGGCNGSFPFFILVVVGLFI